MNSTRTKALALSLFTVGYNLAEGVIAIIASFHTATCSVPMLPFFFLGLQDE